MQYKTAMHQYNQSGDLQLYRTARAVYENGPENAPAPSVVQKAEQQPKPEQQPQQNAQQLEAVRQPQGALQTLLAKGVQGITDLVARLPWAIAKNNAIPDQTKVAINNLPAKAAEIANQTNNSVKEANDAKLREIRPIVEKVADAAPPAPAPIPPPLTEDEKKKMPAVDPSVAGKLDAAIGASPKAPIDTPTVTPPATPPDTSLNLKEVVITEADAAATRLLKQTEALFDTTLKGKITSAGWLNYLGDTNGIAKDIMNTNDFADKYGSFTRADLMTKNTIVSSPVRSVEAITFLQQSLGLAPDGIFGPATYDALVKKNPDAAVILRGEKPADAKLVLD